MAKNPTSLTLTAPGAITYGQAVTVSVSVPGRTGSVSLTGTGTTLTATLSGGQASFTIPTGVLEAGAHALTASWTGDAVYADASATATVSVARASTLFTTLKVTKRPTSTWKISASYAQSANFTEATKATTVHVKG